MLESINNEVDKAIIPPGQFPAAPPAGAPPSDPPADPPATELEQLRAELAALKSERDAEQVQHESVLAEGRLKVAAAQAHAPAPKISAGRQDAQVTAAIRACGGLAYWARLSVQQKAAALNVDGADTKPSLIKQFFGPGSDGAAAQSLATQSPNEYRRLRCLAKLHGIIG